ncbi:MAG TPA: hypothetical protein VFN97_20560 [Actinospica sp.]|nr:hypothetical protein [Actinospica sp.]
MPTTHHRRRRAAHLAVPAALVASLLLTCGCTGAAPSAQPTDGMPGMPGMTGMTGMPGMGEVSSAPTTPALAAAAPDGTGLSASLHGYTLVAPTSPIAADRPDTYTFHITGPSGKAITRYQPYESAFVICYVIRSDLAEFHYLQPAMREDGTWTASLPGLPSGSYRMFTSFAAPDSSQGTPLVYQLSVPFTVSGTAVAAQSADTYALSLSGAPKAGETGPLTISVTRSGEPVTSFQRFLDAYVHLTAFHTGDLAYAHILSLGDVAQGSGTTTAEALFPERGTWRVFAQFEGDGALHTAETTIDVP